MHKILIIDGDLGNAILGKLQIKKQFPSADIAIAQTAKEALNLLSLRPKVDLILTSMHLPDFDGSHLIKHYRQCLDGQATVIAYTNYGPEINRLYDLKSLGFDGWVNKFHPEKLITIINKIKQPIIVS